MGKMEKEGINIKRGKRKAVILAIITLIAAVLTLTICDYRYWRVRAVGADGVTSAWRL